MMAFILVSLALLLMAWLLRRRAQRQIGPSLPGRILYTDPEADRDVLTSDRYNLSGSPDYILEEHGELIPVERKSRAMNSRGPYDSERLQLATYCFLVEERYGKPVHRGRLQYQTAPWISPSMRRCARHSSRPCTKSNTAVRLERSDAVARAQPGAEAAAFESDARSLRLVDFSRGS